ncbi:MAG: D-alanine--D-alanine ligase [Rickettsiaceae bacterium]|nr:D-alanine--D-alanine ligase [Rickettsiaceae bacterium]
MTDFKTIFKAKSDVEVISSSGKKHIVVLAGGMSAERGVSISSAKGVINALVNLGYRVTKIDMGADLANCITQLNPDVVFNCLHGTYGEDGCVPGMLNIMHIPYTHSGLLSSSIAFSKMMSRSIFLQHGIKCADAVYISKGDGIKGDPIKRPYVIKPLAQGSSVGIKVIFEGDDFDFSNYEFEYGDTILVEEYIKGREIEVAVLNGKALGALEIKLLKNKRFYDYETKYTDGFAEHIFPANLSKDAYNKVLKLSERVYSAMDCRGISRVEFIYSDEKDEFYILEINTHPGMTPLSLCPEIAEKVGISFEELIEKILESASYEQ